MCDVVTDNGDPFLHWLRFEWGQNGNPHAHGLGYVSGNPHFDAVVKSVEERERLVKLQIPQAEAFRTFQEAETECSHFYNKYVSEQHPGKDCDGRPYYDFFQDTLHNEEYAKPQCIDLCTMLDDIFATPEPDLTPLKKLLLALVEDGQRHTMHHHNTPTLKVHPCARESSSGGKRKVYCRYLFPRDLVVATDESEGYVKEDPHRPGLKNLFLQRNDSLLNNFEAHLLLSNMGNIDWRPLINLWSVLEYLTKYTAKPGSGSKTLGKVLETVYRKSWTGNPKMVYMICGDELS